MQAASNCINHSESLDPPAVETASGLQGDAGPHKEFGQPVVSDALPVPESQVADEHPLTPSEAAARFQIPEYVIRKACAEGHLEHLRVVNAVWISPAAAASFARICRAGRPTSKS